MPQTYMNLSGNSVGEALSFYKIDSENRLLVVYDDLTFPPERCASAHPADWAGTTA